MNKQTYIVVTHLWQYLRGSDVPEFGEKLNDGNWNGLQYLLEDDNVRM